MAGGPSYLPSSCEIVSCYDVLVNLAVPSVTRCPDSTVVQIIYNSSIGREPAQGFCSGISPTEINPAISYFITSA